MGKFESFLDFLSQPAVAWNYEEEEDNDYEETKTIKQQNRLLTEQNKQLKIAINKLRQLKHEELKQIK